MKRILFPILLLLSLTACSLAPDSYLSVTPHAGTTGQADPADAVEASDYSSLKRAILGFVEAGQTQGTILAASYDGDLERDLTDVAYEITKLNPLGAYAVDYMTHDSTFIVNYYQISIQITFRRTAREIAAIDTIATQAVLQARMQKAVADHESRVTVRMNNYNEPDVAAMVEAYCAANPGTVMQVPAVSVGVYPDSGTSRILEIDLAWTDAPEVLEKKEQAVRENVEAAAEYIRYRQTDREKAELLFTYLSERFAYAEGQTDTPVYDALCSGVADDQGLSRAWQLICDQAGVACWTVEGLRNGESHTWNIVSVDGYYRHVDLARCFLELGVLTLWDDGAMENYYWNQSDYPVCEPYADPAPEETPAEEVPPAEETPAEEEPAAPAP